MLPDVGLVQIYSKSANVNDLGFAWTLWPPLCIDQPSLFLHFSARWFAMLYRDTRHHPYTSARVFGGNITYKQPPPSIYT